MQEPSPVLNSVFIPPVFIPPLVITGSVAQFSCLTLCDPMDCNPPGSSVYGFSRQEYWSELSFPSQGDLPDPGINPDPTLQADSLPLSHQGSLLHQSLWSISFF